MRARAGTCIAVGLFSFAVYTRTLAPGLTWAHNGADGGDLAAAVVIGGVAHPPGYPTYLLLAGLFAGLPLGDVAYRLNLLSAACASITAALVFLLALRLLNGGDGAKSDGALRLAAAASGALAFAFSPVFWSQAVITEVYALNALFVATLLLLAMERRTPLSLIGLVFGLGLGNHLSLVLLAPALALLRRAEWGTTGQQAHQGGKPRLGPLLQGSLGLLAGLAVYALLPLRAAGQPLVNWGAAGTPSGLLWLVSAAPYRGYVFGLPLADLPGRLAAWAGLLAQQLGWVGLALALFGLWDMLGAGEPARRRGWALLVAFALYSVYALAYRTADSFVYLIPAFLVGALWLARGLSTAGQSLRAWSERQSRALQAGALTLTAIAVAVLPLVQLASNWATADLSGDRQASVFMSSIFAELPAGAVVFTASDDTTFALWYGQATDGRNDVIVIDRDLLQFDWYREQLARRAPDLAVAVAEAAGQDTDARALALARAASAGRPVFLAGDPSLLPQVTWQTQGALNRLASPNPP